MKETLGLILTPYKLEVVVPDWNPNTWGVQAEDLAMQGHRQSQFQTNMGHMSTFQNKTTADKMLIDKYGLKYVCWLVLGQLDTRVIQKEETSIEKNVSIRFGCKSFFKLVIDGGRPSSLSVVAFLGWWFWTF